MPAADGSFKSDPDSCPVLHSPSRSLNRSLPRLRTETLGRAKRHRITHEELDALAWMLLPRLREINSRLGE